MNCGSSSCLKQFLTFRAFFSTLTFNAIKEIKAKDWFCCLSSHLVFMQHQFNPVNWEMDSISFCRSSTEHSTELLSNSCLWATKQERVRAYKCSGDSYLLPNLYYCFWCLRGKEFTLSLRYKSEFAGWTVKKEEIRSCVSWVHLLLCPWHLEACEVIQIPFQIRTAI